MKWRVFVGITLRAIFSKALRFSVYFYLFLVCFFVYYYFRVFPLLEGLLFIYVVIVYFFHFLMLFIIPFSVDRLKLSLISLLSSWVGLIANENFSFVRILLCIL